MLFAVSSIPVQAADMSMEPIAFDWSGFYVGAHAGYGEANIKGMYDINDFDPGDIFAENGEGTFDLNLDGFVGGLQAGYNWQSGNFVFGVEGDVTFVDWSDSIYYEPDDDRVSAKTNFVGTLRGRAGFAMDNLLIFGTAGVALTDTKYTGNDDVDDTDPDEIGSLKFKDIGVVVGGGAEFAPNENWSIKAEALYFVFNDDRDASNLNADAEVGDYAELDDAFMVRLGVNFHF